MPCNRLLGSGYERFGGHVGGGGMFIMMGFGFLVFLALIFIAYKLMKIHHSNHSHLSAPSNIENNAAISILNERFAKGEIDEEEYIKRKTILSQK
jgi:putative membrane protein